MYGILYGYPYIIYYCTISGNSKNNNTVLIRAVFIFVDKINKFLKSVFMCVYRNPVLLIWLTTLLLCSNL